MSISLMTDHCSLIRWCVSPVHPTNTALDIWRTSWHVCATSVSMSFSSKRVRLTFKHFITWTENCYIYCKKKKSPGCTILCLIPAIFFLFIRWNLTIRSGVSWEQNCLSLFQEAEENTCRTQRGGSHCFLRRTSFFSWREMSFFFVLCVLGVRKHRQLYH